MAYSPSRHLTSLNAVYDSFEEDFNQFKNYLNSGDEDKELTIYDEAKIIEAVIKDVSNVQAIFAFLEDEVFKRTIPGKEKKDSMTEIVGKISFKLYFEPPLTLIQKMIRETLRIIHSVPKDKFDGYTFVTSLTESLSKIFKQELIKSLRQCFDHKSAQEFVKHYHSQPYLRSDWSKNEDLEHQFKESSAYAELANLVSDLRTGTIHEEITKFLISPFAYCTLLGRGKKSSYFMPLRPIPVILVPYVTRKVAKTKRSTRISFVENEKNTTKDGALHSFIATLRHCKPIMFETSDLEDGIMLHGLKTSVNTPESYYSDNSDIKSLYSEATLKRMAENQISSEDAASLDLQESPDDNSENHAPVTLAQVEDSLEQFSEFRNFYEIVDYVNVIIVNSHVRTETDTEIYVKDTLKEYLNCGMIGNDWNSIPTVEEHYSIGDIVNKDLVIDSISDDDIEINVSFGFNTLKYIIYRDSRSLILYLFELHKTDWHF